MDNEFIKVGVVVVVKQNNKILLGKRLVKVGIWQWGLPGGHLEVGESLVAGAKRELLEETGLVAEELEFINLTNDPRQNEHYIHVVFLANNIKGEPKNFEPEKCEGWDWFDLNNLPIPLFFGHSKLLEAFKNNRLLSD